MASLIELVGGKSPQLLAGYSTSLGRKLLENRPSVGTAHNWCRSIARKSSVLDPELRLAINVWSCEDGHAQERSLFDEVLKTVKPGELWIGERNMCT